MKDKDVGRIAIGMSGGVDSSIAAALLKEQGYEVLGVTIITHKDTQAAEDAKRVADSLRIPHYTIDLTTVFKKKVIEHFTRCYLRGETPNPCVVCNRYIKFGEYLTQARKLGADYIATGHYIRKEYLPNGRWGLFMGNDPQKDQSYMLYSLKQDQVAASVFPLGDYIKEEIRRIAREKNLWEVSEKKDSQEICFIQEDYPSYILKRTGAKERSGNYVDSDGHVLGKHKGLLHYTVGQRKGLGVTFGKPMFVIGFNPEKNEVVLGEDQEVFTDTLWADSINWIALDQLTDSLRIQAKIRYKAQPAAAIVTPENGNMVKISFDYPQRAVTPGQAVVFYDGKLLLGGGRIVSDPRGIRDDLLKYRLFDE